MEQHIIGQGSYGCVFKPGFTCESKTAKSNKMVSKIQRKKNTSESEIEIGKKIKSIPQYADYFAPILSSCTISLAKIDSEEIQKCKFILKDIQKKENQESLESVDSIEDIQKKVYESNKMKYIGKYSLQESILQKYIKNPKYILFYLLRTHNHLLKAFQKLATVNIIHFDIKENNIICNDTTENPIIIDFGFSVNTTDPNPYDFIKKWEDVFYIPWPIDIVFMHSYLSNPSLQISKEYIQHTITEFLEKSYTNTILNTSEQEEFKKKYMTYYASYIGSPIKTLYDECIKYNMTWDNYSLCWTYLNILQNLFPSISNEENKIKKYKALLISTIASLPHERSTPQKTQSDINELFKKMTAIELKKLQTQFTSEINGESIKQQQQLKKKIKNHTLQQIENEVKMIRQRNQ